MPSQKRKLSVGDEISTSSTQITDKKQRQNSSLLFKPNISSNKSSSTIKDNDDSSNQSETQINDESSIPRIPKLSIKRTLNKESNESQFVIESKNESDSELLSGDDDDENDEDDVGDINGDDDDDDDNLDGIEEDIIDEEVDNEDENDASGDDEGVEGDEEDEDEDEEGDEEEEEEEDEDEDENDEIVDNDLLPDHSNTNTLKLKIKNYNKQSKDINENIKISKRGRPSKIKNLDSPEEPTKVKGKRGRKPGYRKYPEGHTAKSQKSIQSKTPRSITSYFLYCQVNRPKIAEKNPELKLRAQQRIVSEMWNKLTDKERLVWRQKAVKLRKKGSKGMISTGIVASTQNKIQVSKKLNNSDTVIKPNEMLATENEVTENEENNVNKSVPIPSNLINFVEDCRPVDLAAYLTLLGQSMTNFGNKMLKLQDDKIEVQGASFVLLDAFLCALGPIFCLTTQIEEMNGCSRETIMNILDNISVLMPES